MKLGMLLLTVFLACSSSKNINMSMKKYAENTQILYEILIENQTGGFLKEETRIIVDDESLFNIYTYVNRFREPEFPIPEIDFSKESVIAVFMGEKTTGGYAVMVENVIEVDGKLIVKIKEVKPGPKDMVTMAITQPFCFVRINSVGKEIIFEKLYNN